MTGWKEACFSHITMEKTARNMKRLWMGKSRDFAEHDTSHQHPRHPEVLSAGKCCSEALPIPYNKGTGTTGCLALLWQKKALSHRQSGILMLQ